MMSGYILCYNNKNILDEIVFKNKARLEAIRFKAYTI